MGRLWIGVGILVLIMGLGIGMLVASQVFYGDFSDELKSAGELVLQENWIQATAKAENCRKNWERYHRFWAAFTDHEPVEEMTSLFARLEIYAQKRLPVEYATVCYQLAHQAKAIDESHSLKWWALL